MKVKPHNHSFRVGTDKDRAQYREQRRQQLRTLIEVRERLGSAIAGDAMFDIPRDDGYGVCEPGSVTGTDDLVAFARDTVESVDLVARRAKANKPFMVRLLEMNEMTLESPLLQFGLRRDVVATVASYLGVIPILQYANIMYSSQVGGELSKSQLYHCDSDETDQIKVFVLCESVTASDGPLTFVPASQSQQVRDRVNYRYKYRLTDDQAQTAFGGSLREVALTGRPGTMAFLDTSRCLHYGSRISAPDARRLVVMLQYITPTAFILPDYPAGTTFGRLAPSCQDAIDRFVLGAATA